VPEATGGVATGRVAIGGVATRGDLAKTVPLELPSGAAGGAAVGRSADPGSAFSRLSRGSGSAAGKAGAWWRGEARGG